ncbi:hypothetical protein QR98_0066110 [Sarcoptes scabiei]|nr:hypothetical protein QR98_0066110 [Sarcoptes scabiei]
MAIVSLSIVYLLLVIKPLFIKKISADEIEYIDLSYDMSEGIMKWITAREYEMKIFEKIVSGKNSPNAIRVQSDEVYMATHTGTHLDSPVHFGGKDKWSVSEIPLKNLVDVPLSVMDVTKKIGSNRDFLVQIKDIKEWEEIFGEIPKKSVLILATGWSKLWPNKKEYFGTDTNNPELAHFPGLAPSAARWLMKERQIVGVGIDGPSIDCGQCSDKLSHVFLNSNNVYILENINQDILYVPPVGSAITILPLRLDKASGCPVRPIVRIHTNGHNLPVETNDVVVGTQPQLTPQTMTILVTIVMMLVMKVIR